MAFDASSISSIGPVAAASPVDGRTRVDPSLSGPTTPTRVGTTVASADSDPDAKAAVDELTSALAQYGVALEFRQDDDTGAIVIKVLDAKSGEQLRQIPNEASLKLSAEFEKLQGRIFSRRA